MKHTRSRVGRWGAAAALVCASVWTSACGGGAAAPASDDAKVTDDVYAELVPAAPVLTRLTQAQYRNAVRDLLGDDLALPATLEPDAAADGLLAAGAAVTTVSPRGAELYEEAALSLARQATETPERRARVLPCEPTAESMPCFGQFIADVGRRAWRRPLTSDEIAAFELLAGDAAQAFPDDPVAPFTWALAGLMQSPHFLYRVEAGEPDPEAPGARRLSAFELATRLAFFLWNAPPDEALLAAAEAGDLDTADGLVAQVDRLLAADRAREGVRSFVSDWLHLHQLPELKKDPNVFKHFSPDLAAAAREETLRVAEHIVFEREGDLGELFTTRTTFINRRLAAIYDIPAPVLEGFGQTELPADGPRRGLLGHVSFLGLHSHPTSSSATLRGIFLRETLLCDMVPDPPSDLNTAIPEPSPDAPTLRDRLQVHLEDPMCASCHRLTDPVGLGFEPFDGMGRVRATENGVPIDPTGDLDGVAFADPAELAAAVAASPKLTACFVKKMYTYAVARPTEPGEQGQLAALTDAFEADGRRVLGLMRAVAISEGFRRVGEVQ